MAHGDPPHAAPPLDQAQRMLRLLPRLRRWAAMRVTQAGGTTDLSLRQYATLYAIRQGTTSQTALARQWQVTPAVITGIVDRLERRGLLRREADLTDRRRLHLTLTEEGLHATLSLERALAQDLAAQLQAATLAELGALDRALALLERVVGVLEARVPAVEDSALADEEMNADADEEESPAAPARGVEQRRRTRWNRSPSTRTKA